MKLREQLLREHSRANCLKVVEWVGDSPVRFAELIELFLKDEYRVVQLAAWPISYVVESHPALIRKHLPKIIKNLERKDTHPAVRRNTIRLFQHIDIPEKYQGTVMNLCFEYVCDPTEKAALKAFSLTVLENLSKQYPEIKPELKTIIEERWDTETPAFRSRAKKIMKKL
ncbi:hypothetical protein LZZ85_19895 [Terrimonas sp. NA20]|uniref:HEAT repeat domain-containing protein n=1 Tax=Terrimonas ginsenosidimutans TaxID=2908004 RepID=A0ABS9KW39_9BACT|nr:hypothetical protein [Terrimonas ginsenosidimutans]MCG2616572.1 hypothetical protein [Terrimonas ginsenosidimutans]